MIFNILNAYPESWQITFQDPATEMMRGIVDLHHDIFAFLTLILIFVSVILFSIILLFGDSFLQQLQAYYRGSMFRLPSASSEKMMIGTIPYKLWYSFYFGNYVTPQRLIVKSSRKGRILFPNTSKYHTKHNWTHNTRLEIIWTLVPTFILLCIATPSFALIYALDEILAPEITIRVIGRQWYWSYEINTHVFNEGAAPFTIQTNYTNTFADDFVQTHDVDFRSDSGLKSSDTSYALANTNREFSYVVHDSYLLPEEDLLEGQMRLLDVDKPLILPEQTGIRLLVSASDVLHSWAVPSFGIKIDAIPGRLNEQLMFIQFTGSFFGQCSEICGVNHGFMPIRIDVITRKSFIELLARQELFDFGLNRVHILS